ncbi:hypothetical protein O181_053805 [Austropuccinia psidii MF-1]|uniref:Uncharacterized protein n=1 Tax=Austropuccinia psidii MF-1 TaxID=1389203 RepID=A0A9Q3HTT9_9BASI|nr:hypothetical protein [Austropuccinia psidii MF-1]
MSPLHLKNLGFQRNQQEDREGLSRTRRPGRGHLGHSGGSQDTEGNHTHPAIHFRGLKRHGSSSSAPPTRQRLVSMEHGKQERPYGNNQRLESHQEVQTSGGEGKQDKRESSHYQSYRRTADPDRAYSDSFRLTSSRPNQLSTGFIPFRNQQISGQESPFFTIPGSFQEKTRIQGQNQDHLQPEEERVRSNDPEAVRFGERSKQEPEVVVNSFGISSPIIRNATPTQIDHNVVTPESNLNSDTLWLQMSQYAEKTQKQFTEHETSHGMMKILTSSMERIVKSLQEGHSQLRKASEETNKRLDLVSEEKHHRKKGQGVSGSRHKQTF